MKMKFFELIAKMKTSKKTAGFTMIELLIVIAILGILAVAVLSAINPVEQINRGRDTGSRSDAEQLISAIDRYNAFQGFYPWQEGASDDVYGITPLKSLTAETVLLQHTTNCQVSDLLGAGDGACIGANELKVTFFSRIFNTNYNYLAIYHGENASDSTYVCFAPKSDAFKTEATARAVDVGNLPADYPATAIDNALCGADATADCICLP